MPSQSKSFAPLPSTQPRTSRSIGQCLTSMACMMLGLVLLDRATSRLTLPEPSFLEIPCASPARSARSRPLLRPDRQHHHVSTSGERGRRVHAEQAICVRLDRVRLRCADMCPERRCHHISSSGEQGQMCGHQLVGTLSARRLASTPWVYNRYARCTCLFSGVPDLVR